MKTNQLKTTLVSTGLSNKEADIYLYLLENGPSKASQIFENYSELKKGNTYALLDKLEAKDLVKKEGMKFVPQPPQVLLNKLKEKSKTLQNKLNYFETLMPQLNSKYKLSVGKPTIKYYEGREGLVEVFKDIYAPKDEPVYGAIDVDQIEGIFDGLSEGKLIPSRIENELEVKVMFNDTKFARELHQKDELELRESLILDKEKYPLPAEIEAYEDKIALMSFEENDFIGLIIENEDIATTLKSVFKFAFSHMKSCKNAADDSTQD